MVIPVREKAFMLAALCLTRQRIRWSSLCCTQRMEFNCFNIGICCHLRNLRLPHLVSSCLHRWTQVSCKSCDIPVSPMQMPGVTWGISNSTRHLCSSYWIPPIVYNNSQNSMHCTDIFICSLPCLPFWSTFSIGFEFGRVFIKYLCILFWGLISVSVCLFAFVCLFVLLLPFALCFICAGSYAEY